MKKHLKILALCTRKDIIVKIERELSNLELAYQLIELYQCDEIHETLKNTELDIIAIDMNIPDCDYMSILKMLKEDYPHLVRILIAEEWSKELVVMTNDLVHLIIEKKYLSEMLVNTIIRAEQMRELLKNDKLTQLINSFDELPIMQNVYIELLHMLQTPDVPLKKIGDLISKEYSLTAKILQVANMSIFTHLGRINNPQQAVVFLGTNVIRAVILYLQVFSFDTKNPKQFKFINQLESHCLHVSELARKISTIYHSNTELQDDTFTTALLHDIGKLIIITKTNKLEEIIEYSEKNHCDLWKAELEILGTSHAEIGAYLLSLWGFPSSVINGVAYHHQASKSKNNEFSPLTFVHIAESLIHQNRIVEESIFMEKIDTHYINLLGLEDQINDLYAQVNESVTTE